MLEKLVSLASPGAANTVLPEFETTIAACENGGAFQISRFKIENNRHYFFHYLQNIHIQQQKIYNIKKLDIKKNYINSN